MEPITIPEELGEIKYKIPTNESSKDDIFYIHKITLVVIGVIAFFTLNYLLFSDFNIREICICAVLSIYPFYFFFKTLSNKGERYYYVVGENGFWVVHYDLNKSIVYSNSLYLFSKYSIKRQQVNVMLNGTILRRIRMTYYIGNEEIYYECDSKKKPIKGIWKSELAQELDKAYENYVKNHSPI